MMDKMTDAAAWGAPSTWDEDKFASVDALLPGLDENALADIPDGTFAASLDNFGKQVDWAMEQIDVLARKLEKAIGDFESASADLLNKAPQLLPGVKPENITKIPKEEMKKCTSAFADAAKKIGAFAADQFDAIAASLKDAWGEMDTLDEAAIDEIGPLIGAYPADDIAKLPETTLDNIPPAAIKNGGGKKFVEALGKDKLKKLSNSTRAAFTGQDLAEVAAAGKDLLKAILGCDEDESKCPKAICDNVIDHDGSKTDEELLAQVSKVLADKNVEATSLQVQMKATPKASSTSTTRRRLTTTTTSTANQQTVVRVTTSTNAAAQETAAATSAAGLATPSVIQVTATDTTSGGDNKNTNTVVSSSSANGPTMMAIVAIAAALSRTF